MLVIDRHPDYLPSRFGRDWAAAASLELIEVQHHHAHIAACMADNGIALNAPPVLGVALDGTGYGADGSLWGGEFLLADYRGYRRLASLSTVAMPGGEAAIEQPWRMTYAHLRRLAAWHTLTDEFGDLPYFRMLANKPLATLNGMLASGFNSPRTSSCGRLFDAVSALIGVCQTVSYEGQAAIELEAIVDRKALDQGYPFAIVLAGGLPRLEPQPMWRRPAGRLARQCTARRDRGALPYRPGARRGTDDRAPAPATWRSVGQPHRPLGRRVPERDCSPPN